MPDGNILSSFQMISPKVQYKIIIFLGGHVNALSLLFFICYKKYCLLKLISAWFPFTISFGVFFQIRDFISELFCFFFWHINLVLTIPFSPALVQHFNLKQKNHIYHLAPYIYFLIVCPDAHYFNFPLSISPSPLLTDPICYKFERNEKT